MPKILVVGSINVDLIYRVPYIITPGETLHSTSCHIGMGGKGANQAVTAAQLQAEVYFVGAVGEDYYGDYALQNLRDRNVKTPFIKQEGATGQAIIQVTDQGENAIILVPGANYHITAQQLDEVCDCIKTADILLLQLEVPLAIIEQATKLATAAGTKIMLNPAPAQPLSDALLQQVTILTPNETELALLTGVKAQDDKGLKEACQLLLAKGVQGVVVTLGSRGVFYYTNKRNGYVAAKKVPVKDTTGAGDAFNGALAVALSKGQSLEDAISYANEIAAYVVTQSGAQPDLAIHLTCN